MDLAALLFPKRTLNVAYNEWLLRELKNNVKYLHS